MPRWDDYGAALDRIRFEASPLPVDFADHTMSQMLALVQAEDWTRGWSHINAYGEALGLAAEKAAKDEDRVNLEKIGRTLHQLVERLSRMDEHYLTQAIARRVLVSGCKGLAKAWQNLGEPERAKPYEEIVRDLGPSRSRAPVPSPAPDALDLGQTSAFLAKTILGSRKPHSTPVSEAEVRAGRMAEYAMYERFMIHVGAVFLFLVAIFLGITWWRDRRKLGLLPERLAGMLQFRDHLLILALGFGLPVAVYAASTRGDYLGARDFALGEERFILWILQIVSLGVAVLLLSLSFARCCLSRRATMLAMEGRLMDTQVWMAILALGMIPVGAVLPRVLSSGKWMEMMCWSSAGFMAGLPLLWVLYLAVYQFAGNPATRLHRALLVRGVIWPLCLAMLLAVAAIPLLYAEEKSWVARLDYDALSPEFDIFNTRGERDEGRWLQGDLKRYLESIR
ncbi:hypothetical protein [Luteolibacter sp. Populi]|uniref:hypothetical protein n=1 Tax=Luteolibacter sp. Populi TaxID=3230487 RepID=UPI003466AD83